MKKLGYRQFSLELTRRCTMNCIHCSRGEAENLDMSEEILYSALSNLPTIEDFMNDTDNSKYTSALYFYGGEPFLCPEMIHKCMDYIIENELFIISIWAITNGTILSDEIAKDFQRVIPHLTKCRKLFTETYGKNLDEVLEEDESKDISVAIEISYNYHDKTQSDRALEFYKKYENIYVKLFDKDVFDKDKKIHSLSYRGRAKNLVNNKNIFFQIKDNHCMATNLKENYVSKTICVGANGNLFLGLDYEYSDVDNDNMGNVLNESIYDMAIKWNWKHPILYSEMKKWLRVRSTIFNHENGFITDKPLSEFEYEEIKKVAEIYKHIVIARREFHEKYDCLPIEQLIVNCDMAMEVESDGMYIEFFYDEEDRKDYDFKKEKQNFIEGLQALTVVNDNYFYDKEENKELKVLREKYPCLERSDCIALNKAIGTFRFYSKRNSSIAEKMVNESIGTIRSLKLKYLLYDMTMDDDIEQKIKMLDRENMKKLTSAFGNLFIELLKSRSKR